MQYTTEWGGLGEKETFFILTEEKMETTCANGGQFIVNKLVQVMDHRI